MQYKGKNIGKAIILLAVTHRAYANVCTRTEEGCTNVNIVGTYIVSKDKTVP